MLFLALTLITSVYAFPSATCSYAAGNLAIYDGPHLKGRITTGSLATGGLSVTLGGVTLFTLTTTTFAVGIATPLTISSTKKFEGLFMRFREVGGVQTEIALAGTGMVQVAKPCTAAGVGGVCQTSNSDRNRVTTNIQLGAVASSMTLDITIVALGDKGISVYNYSQFLMSAILAEALQRMSPFNALLTMILTRDPTASLTTIPTSRGPTKKPTNL